MARIAYVNGAYVPMNRARLHIEDRGAQFADAIYEVWSLRDGVLFDVAGHLARMRRSLHALHIGFAMTDASLMAVVHETVRRNRVRNAIVYLQIGRGAAPRNHLFPSPDTPPSLVITARPADWSVADAKAKTGARVITTPDIRWGRCDIKTVGLLPNALAKQSAKQAGADEAWMVDTDGRVTEGSSTNAWIVTDDDTILTRPVTDNILAGITREKVIALAKKRQLTVIERAFGVDEALAAREAFMTSATTFVTPIVQIDGQAVGHGEPGPVALGLRRDYFVDA